ncbi:nucleoside deaminase [Aquabacter sp. L1I39]|uniref:deaminase n=1 Tax=Aquabacter sp. L1I39 TaxID=2820278 RepID=UPI001AD96BA0|nr:deaminase [Aquabacter sp. L1I39]QTL03499.1 nucleoside deaminase [Aquabacter sp. L1I39]
MSLMDRRTFGTLMGALAFSPAALAQEARGATAGSERDTIFSLAVLDMVYRDWQSAPNGRGHNIGSVLVDKDNRPVFWARNCVTVTNNATQHGEVRLIQAFLSCPGVGKYMTGYTIYTTLEPCAMCTGMIAMTQVDRVVFVQADPEFGHALAGLKHVHFPRLFQQATVRPLPQKQELEQGWAAYRDANKGSAITDYLLSANAKTIYGSASGDLDRFKVRNRENEAVLAATQDFLKGVGAETFGVKMQDRCPAKI